MPDSERPQQPDQRTDAGQGDHIQAAVEQAQTIAIGKSIVQNIVQHISNSLHVPAWWVYALAAPLFVLVGLALWLVILVLRGGIPVALQPVAMPTPATAVAVPTSSTCPAGRQCVLVADFDPAGDDLAGEITRKIRTTLNHQELLPPYNFTVMPVEVVTGTEAAQQLASREDALVIVWGQVFSTLEELNIHFALTDRFGIDEAHGVRPYRVHYFEALTQRISCRGACFSDATSLRGVLDQISAVIAYTAAGMLHFATDQPEVASAHFQAALFCSGEIEEAPPLARPPLCLAGEAGQQRHSIEGFNPATVYYYAGKAGILAGDYALAIDYLQEAAERNGQDPAAWIAIATAYQSWLNQDDAPQVQEALAQARQRLAALAAETTAVQAPQQDAAVAYELGFVAELANDLALAQKEYAAAVDGFGGDDPAAYVALVALGRVQRKAGQLVAAEETLQQAIDVDAGEPWAYLELAQTYRKYRDRAEDQLAAAAQAAPNQAYVDIVRAELCAAWQDGACVADAYARALEQRPHSGWLHGRVGDYFRSEEQWEQAAVHYESAILLRPHDPWEHERLAFVYFQLGKYADAVQHYALSFDQYSHPQTRLPERRCTLGQMQHAAQQLSAALASYQACLSGLPEGEQRTQVEEWIAELQALE